MKRKLRTTEEWLGLYEQQQTSGLTMRKWCADHDVNLYTMADRVSRLRKEGYIQTPKPARGRNSTKCKAEKTMEHAEQTDASWIEVIPEKITNITEKQVVQEPKTIFVTIGIFQIQLTTGFCEDTFLRACKTLVSLC